jgi:hypothetical protein
MPPMVNVTVFPTKLPVSGSTSNTGKSPLIPVTGFAATCRPSTNAATTVPTDAGDPLTKADPKKTCGSTGCADAPEGVRKMSATTATVIRTLSLGISFKFNLDDRCARPASTRANLVRDTDTGRLSTAPL